jgi:hypothetical protein
LAVEQQDVEMFKAIAANVEETIERDERTLDALNGREREDLYWRLRWRRRELKLFRKRLAQLEADLFARDVLGDVRSL